MERSKCLRLPGKRKPKSSTDSIPKYTSETSIQCSFRDTCHFTTINYLLAVDCISQSQISLLSHLVRGIINGSLLWMKMEGKPSFLSQPRTQTMLNPALSKGLTYMSSSKFFVILLQALIVIKYTIIRNNTIIIIHNNTVHNILLYIG